MPAQAYHFEVSPRGGAAVRCHFKCRLRDRHQTAEPSALKKGEFSRLLKHIQASEILERASEPPRFLPDTLVGVLEISDGQSSQRTWFAADAPQALVQHRKMRPELGKLVD